MKVKFYGVRGSIPVSDPNFQEFGGNTTCILISGIAKNVAILDAGTGIRTLGKELIQDPSIGVDKPVYIGFSHFHWDHIQGLPFFEPAYDPQRSFVLSAIGKGRHVRDLESIFALPMQQEYFPVALHEMGAKFHFYQPETDSVQASGVLAHSIKHNHPGGAYSYRLEDRYGNVLVYCTDIEHGDDLDPKIVEFARNADLLIHDGQYTPGELKRKKGWGHSSWEQAIQVAEQAGVKRLAITHHDPDHDDQFLRAVEKECRSRFPDSFLAREKQEIEL